MRFEPMTDEEIQKSMFIEDGEYTYRVIKSTDKVSQKTGKDYIALDLLIWDKSGKEKIVFCNLGYIRIIKHFCDVNGMQDDYMLGDIPSYKFMNKSGGKAVIGFEPEKANPEGGTYKAKNVVLDFVKETTDKKVGESKKTDAELFDQDLPF